MVWYDEVSEEEQERIDNDNAAYYDYLYDLEHQNVKSEKITVSISLEEIYDMYNGTKEDGKTVKAENGVIVYSENDGKDYYDLVVNDEVCYMDGEEVEIINQDTKGITFKNKEEDKTFKLSTEECKKGIFANKITLDKIFERPDNKNDYEH